MNFWFWNMSVQDSLWQAIFESAWQQKYKNNDSLNSLTLSTTDKKNCNLKNNLGVTFLSASAVKYAL